MVGVQVGEHDGAYVRRVDAGGGEFVRQPTRHRRQLAAGESAGPRPASTRVTGPSPHRTAKQRNWSHQPSSTVTAPGSRASAAFQCAAVAAGNASVRGWKKGPSPSKIAVTVIDPRVRLGGIRR